MSVNREDGLKNGREVADKDIFVGFLIHGTVPGMNEEEEERSQSGGFEHVLEVGNG